MQKADLETLYELLSEFQAQAPHELGSTEDRTLSEAIWLIEDQMYGLDD